MISLSLLGAIVGSNAATHQPTVLHIPDEFTFTNVYRIPLKTLYPKTVQRVYHSPKPFLQYGIPSAETRAIIDFVESIPVEERIREIEMFEQSRSPRFEFASRKDETWYSKYLFATSVIDMRLLRLFIRIFSYRRNPDERGISTACEIIDHLHKKFPDGSFDYLTPDYIIDWYNGFGGNILSGSSVRGFALLGSKDELGHERALDQDEDKQIFIHVAPNAWQSMILSPRKFRLTATGCESPPIFYWKDNL